jgi:hypothetical protein
MEKRMESLVAHTVVRSSLIRIPSTIQEVDGHPFGDPSTMVLSATRGNLMDDWNVDVADVLVI